MHARYIGVMVALLCGCLTGACKDSTIEDLQEARRLLVIGESEDSMALYKKVLERNPNAVEAHVKLAEIYLNREEVELAKPHIDSAVELAPDNAGANYVRGRYLLTRKLWVQAGQSLEIASREDLFSPDVQFWLGVALARLGKDEKAIPVFQRVLNMKPEYPGVHRQLGSLFFSKGDYDRAMQEYEDAIAEVPEDIESLKQLALSYHYQSFNESALKTAEKLLELDPESASAYNIMGAVAFANRDIEAAQEHFEKAVSLDPDLLAAHVNLGAIYNATGDIDKSLAEYKRALELDPANVQVQKNMGDLHFTRGEFDQALEYYRTYHNARPKDPFVAYLGAKLIARSRDADPQEGHDMLNKLERATGLDVAMNEVRFALTTKRSEPNGKQLNLLVKTIPYLHDVLAVRMLLYERMGDLERAEETVKIVLLMNMETAKREAFEKRLEAYKRGETPPSPFD